MTVLRHIAAILLLPGVVAVVVPAVILRATRPLAMGWSWSAPFSLIPITLGVLLMAGGLWLMVQTIALFVIVGQGTLAPQRRQIECDDGDAEADTDGGEDEDGRHQLTHQGRRAAKQSRSGRAPHREQQDGREDEEPCCAHSPSNRHCRLYAGGDTATHALAVAIAAPRSPRATPEGP